MRTRAPSKAWLLGTAAVVGLALPAAATAQAPTGSATVTTTGAPSATALSSTQTTSLGEVVVTARKRVERLLDVPVAITAFTSADLAAKDIQTLEDISAYTPGLADDQSETSSARADRSNQELIIRGMSPSSNPSGNPSLNTSLFINGVPVASEDFLQSLDDTQRVEVLKGPQSAYFGRDTFAGAVNVIPTPAGDKFTGNFSGELGSRETQIVSGSVTVPIWGDKLSVRAGGFYNRHDGSYDNAANPGETLGDQETQGGHVAITAKPIQNLTIKAFGMIFQDNDGPAATGLLLSSAGLAGTPLDQSNCIIAGTPFFCGTLPHLLSSVSPAQNDVNQAGVQAFLQTPGGGYNGIKTSNRVNGFGLRRDAYHGDLNIDYTVPNLGLTLTYLGGFNRDNWSEISDISNEDGAAGGQYPGYTGFAFAVEQEQHDFSHEVRLTSDPAKRYRFMLGGSYVNSYGEEFFGLAQYGLAVTPNGGPTQSQTASVFFSLAYDILPPLTLTFDGRYQSDKEKAFGPTGVLEAEGTADDFLPRVSLQYKIRHNLMTYLTYSEGVNPGIFNTGIFSLPAASVAELNGAGVAGSVAVKPEHLTNYEVGVKGAFLNNKATVAVDFYYDKWSDQISSNSYIFSSTDPANPYNVPGYGNYNPTNTSPYFYSYANNSAKSTAKGFEFEGDLVPLDHLNLNLAGAINDTTYDHYTCGAAVCYPYTSAYNAAGKHLPNAPEYSLNFGAQYGTELNVFKAKDWYVRGDFIYRSGIYLEASNDTKTQDIDVLNVRGGINWPNFSVEGYINNITDNKSFTSGIGDDDFAGGFSETSVMVGLPQLITGGVRVRFHF